MNIVILSGNLGQTPELRHSGEGKPFLPLRLATNETWYDGERRQERTNWHDLVVWGARAEGLARVLTKGMRLNVQGSLRAYQYEKDGEQRYGTEVNVRDVEILGGGAKDEKAEPPPAKPAKGARS